MRKLIAGVTFALLPIMSGGLTGNAVAATSGAAIVGTALQYVGYPYTTVGNSPATGFSCIGFVSYVYQVNGIPVPDDLGSAMAYAPAVSFADLLPGDVLFFQNTVWPGLSHTAIYLGGGRFVHAEWYNRGVVTSSFTNDPIDGNYWIDHYLGANRPWSVATAPAPAPAVPAPVAAGTTSAPAAAPAPVPQLENGPRARVQVSGLNVRVRPSLFAPVRRLVTGGTSLVVLKQYNSWDWVQLPNGSFGWVAGAAIGTGGTPAEAVAAQPLLLTTPSVYGLRVHARPNLAAPIVGVTSHGQKLLVVKRWLGWQRVVLPSGIRGWVDGAYIGSGSGAAGSTYRARNEAAPPSDSAGATTGATGSTISATVRVHARPGLEARVLGIAPEGVRVRVLSSMGQWARVRLPGGRWGWVYRAYLSGR